MTAISVCLVGKEGLLKEGVKSLLAKNGFYIAGDYDGVAAIQKEAVVPEPVHLVVSIDGGCGDEALSKKINTLKNIYSQSRVIVISGHAETPAIMPAFSAGIDGLIQKDISCEGLIGSLKLAAAGEKVYPTSMLSVLSNDTPQPAGADNQNGTHRLSRQELKIIHCLANGDPNKVIAYHLDITEATVKVHVKTILRKLGATNRTQAAIWAIAHGLADAPKEIRRQAG